MKNDKNSYSLKTEVFLTKSNLTLGFNTLFKNEPVIWLLNLLPFPSEILYLWRDNNSNGQLIRKDQPIT